MSLKYKRRELHGVIGGIGVVCILAGAVGFMSWPTAIVAAFAFWIIGATVVNLLTEATREDPNE